MDDATEEAGEASASALIVAGIGASAGGVKALQAFFAALPENPGAAVIVVLHLDPDHQSDLAQVIATHTRMPVQQVGDRCSLEADQVYVIPPNRQLTIGDSEVFASEFVEPRGQRAPIDQLFRSLAGRGGRAIAVILSGAGSDGALGVRAVKETGGLILVQDPGEAEYGSMPRAAIAAGDADFVLPVQDLARQFAELVRRKGQAGELTASGEAEELLGRIVAHLRVRTGHDFAQYKRASLMRRLERRIQVVKAQNMSQYLEYLRSNPGEVQALFADLLISVTRFFRDPKSFEQLERIAVPAILAREGANETIRIWVPGCATGEEAYSIAMAFLDHADQAGARPNVHIFATDLDAGALRTAREGCYPATIGLDVSEERLRRYFTREGNEYRVKREIRDLVVFALHSVVKDPPFSRVNLISCRNLLIYINRALQEKVISTFHYALVPDGYLFLGSSETADQPQGLFRTIDRGARIFQSAGRQANEPLLFRAAIPDLRVAEPGPIAPQGERHGSAEPQQRHRLALIELGPPSVLVDEFHRILNVSEMAGSYLLHPPGAPTTDVTELVRPELASELRLLLGRAFQQSESGMTLPIPVQFNGHSRKVCLQVSPISGRGAPRALVLFIESGPAELPIEPEALSEAKGEADATARRLREELLATQASLKASRQEFAASTENLRAANEELQSINEEYRSTAEELETSREELQSMNEELVTLNNELRSKLDAISLAHNDLENLLIATDVGTLFLDRDLRIKRFTPRMRELFNISFSDEGRAISDFTSRLDYPGFEDDAREVMRDGKAIKKTIRGKEGRWYLMQLRPYRTQGGEVEGVLATFVDAVLPPEPPAARRRKRAKN